MCGSNVVYFIKNKDGLYYNNHDVFKGKTLVQWEHHYQNSKYVVKRYIMDNILDNLRQAGVDDGAEVIEVTVNGDDKHGIQIYKSDAFYKTPIIDIFLDASVGSGWSPETTVRVLLDFIEENRGNRFTRLDDSFAMYITDAVRLEKENQLK